MIKPNHDYRSPLSLTGDPDEGRFLMAFLNFAIDNKLRLDYANSLAELAPERAELIHLQCLLLETESSSTEFQQLQRRYKEARAQLHQYEMWLKVVEMGLDIIFKCQADITDLQSIRFRFRCPNDWMLMKPTDNAGVRFCDQCSQNVYFCNSREEVYHHASNNRCIAMPNQLGTGMMNEIPATITGQVDLYSMLYRKLYPKDPQR